MRKVLSISLFMGLTFTMSPASAASPYYVGVDLLNWSYDEASLPALEGTGFRGRFGSNYSENFAFEAHLGAGGSDSIGAFKWELDWIYSIFYRANIPVGEGKLYGMFGLTSIELTGSAGGFAISGSDSDVSYGGGFEYPVNRETALSADYIIYLDESAYDFTAFSIGITHSF